MLRSCQFVFLLCACLHGASFTGLCSDRPSRSCISRRAMDSVFSIFHPNFQGRLSDEAKRASMDQLLQKAQASDAKEGYILSREVEDFHKRIGWSPRQLQQWFDKHQDGLWCRLSFSNCKKGNKQMTVISAKVWEQEMEVHLSQTGTNTKIVVVKDLTNLKLFCSVAGIGYTKAIQP